MARSEPLAALVYYVVYQEKVALRVKCIYKEANCAGYIPWKRIERF